MIRSAVTVCLVPEAHGGPFVYHCNLEEGCARAAAAGFDAVEIFPAHADELDGHRLRELLRRHDLGLAAVGTGAGWLRHRLSLTDPDPLVRARARDFIGAAVDFAGGFGAPAIIGSMQGRHGGDVSRDQALEWLGQALEQLGPRAHALGAPLLYEPLNRYETNLLHTVADTLGFLGTLRTRNVRLLCDLFHMNIEEDDIAAALLAAGDRLGHVHFADTQRRVVGSGHLDVAPVARALHALGYAGHVSAEVLPRPDADTAAARTIESFRRWFPR